MKIKAKGLLQGVSTLALAGVIALAPLQNAAAAGPVVWGGATSEEFGTSSNWVGGIVPNDGDTIVFDSSDPGVAVGAYDTPAIDLTNGTGARPAGVTVTGNASDVYAFTLDTLRVQSNAVLQNNDPSDKSLTIASLTADGNVILDGVKATSGTFAGNITLKNQGATTDTGLKNYTLTAGNKIILSAGMTNVVFSNPELLDGYTIQVDPGAVLTLTADADAYLAKIILNGGFLKTTGTATASDVTLAANSKYWVIGSTNHLIINEFTTGGFTLTAHDSNEGTFLTGNTNIGDDDDDDDDDDDNNGNNNGGNNNGGNNNGGNTDDDDDVPGTPDTAFHAIATNPLTAVIATIAIIAATAGIVRLQRTRR